MSFDYDLFVIGGGSGGVRAARVAAGDTGAKVALAEEAIEAQQLALEHLRGNRQVAALDEEMRISAC